MTKYKIITNCDPEIMSEIVNLHLVDGWVLDGNLTICPGPSVHRQTIYAQAMVKTLTDKE